jgi:hypothetical protein
MTIVRDVIALLEKNSPIQTEGEPDGRPYLEADTMNKAIGYDGKTFTVGDRVEIHPGTDLWMMGARYGTVKSIVPTSEDRVRVEMDKVRGLRSGPADRFRAV